MVLLVAILSTQVYAADLSIDEGSTNVAVGEFVTRTFILTGDSKVTFHITSENVDIVSVNGGEWYMKNYDLEVSGEVKIPVKLYGESEGVAKVWYGLRGESKQYMLMIEVGNDEVEEVVRGSGINNGIGNDGGDGGAGTDEAQVKAVKEAGLDIDNKGNLAGGGIFIVISITLLIIATFSGIVLRKINERKQ